MSIFSKKYVFLFPPSKTRLESLNDILNGVSRPERYLFYGLDLFKSCGLPLVHNLRSVSLGRLLTIVKLIHKKICSRLFVYYGEIEWIFPVFMSLYRSPLIFVFSERIMLAICYWKLCYLLPNRPTVFMPMGLPEKLQVLRDKKPKMFRLVIKSLSKIERIICVSRLEEETLNDEFGLSNTCFIRVGVDTDYFSPIYDNEDVDVLSIGADNYRDFELLINSARQLKKISYRIITTRFIADSFINIPENIEILTDIPMLQIRSHISRARILALPVIPNSYSGATTVLLQAMAMEKTVIANQEGSNKTGYPFFDKQNLVYVKSCDLLEMNTAIKTLLDNDVLRKRIGDEARKIVLDQLGLENFHRNLFMILNEVHVNAWGTHISGWSEK